MTVAELRKELEGMPDDAIIISGWCDILQVWTSPYWIKRIGRGIYCGENFWATNVYDRKDGCLLVRLDFA